jgi:hypothetical protein
VKVPVVWLTEGHCDARFAKRRIAEVSAL